MELRIQNDENEFYIYLSGFASFAINSIGSSTRLGIKYLLDFIILREE